MNNSAQNSGSGTCLHCNTMRRTTGVHQTTQTGPVSPIPQNMNNKTVFLGFSETGDYDKASTGSATGLRQVCSNEFNIEYPNSVSMRNVGKAHSQGSKPQTFLMNIF